MKMMKAVIQSVRLEYRRNSYDKHSFFQQYYIISLGVEDSSQLAVDINILTLDC